MSFHKMVINTRSSAQIVLLAALCAVAAGCRTKENIVVIRILVPPSPSALREAIAKLQYSPLTTDSGRKIVPATVETKDATQYRTFLENIQIYRPQIVVVPEKSYIPAQLKGERSYTTLPCSASSSRCVAVLTPWMSNEERGAANLILQHIEPATVMLSYPEAATQR